MNAMRTGIAFRQAAELGPAAMPPYRVVVAGAELRLLVLAADVNGCVGVDLDTGAFVRASHPAGDTLPQPFDVVAAEIAGAVEPPDPARPIALKRAERLLAPLHHPPRLPLLGLAANAVPYWTLTGESPSVTLIEVRSDPRLRWGHCGPECHFMWQGQPHELLLADRRLLDTFERDGMAPPTRGEVCRILGYRPRRLLVMLTAPIDGYCHKAVAALLPSSR
jgi:hypothetical protein